MPGTFGALGLLLPHFEDLLEAGYLVFRLGQMVFETFLQLRIGGGLNELWERLQDLVLGVVDILETVVEQVLQSFDVAREEAHGRLLCCGVVAINHNGSG